MQEESRRAKKKNDERKGYVRARTRWFSCAPETSAHRGKWVVVVVTVVVVMKEEKNGPFYKLAFFHVYAVHCIPVARS